MIDQFRSSWWGLLVGSLAATYGAIGAFRLGVGIDVVSVAVPPSASICSSTPFVLDV